MESAFEEMQSIELNKAKTFYKLIGPAAKGRAASLRELISAVLPDHAPGLNQTEITDALTDQARAEGFKAPVRKTVVRELNAMLKAGLVNFTGQADAAGGKNEDVQRYYSTGLCE